MPAPHPPTPPHPQPLTPPCCRFLCAPLQNEAILHRYANEDVAVGSWLVGLDIQYDNQRRLCCDTEWKCTQQVRGRGAAWGGPPLPRGMRVRGREGEGTLLGPSCATEWQGTQRKAPAEGAARRPARPASAAVCPRPTYALSPPPRPALRLRLQSNKENVCLGFSENQCAGLCRSEERLEGIYRDCVVDPYSAGGWGGRAGGWHNLPAAKFTWKRVYYCLPRLPVSARLQCFPASLSIPSQCTCCAAGKKGKLPWWGASGWATRAGTVGSTANLADADKEKAAKREGDAAKGAGDAAKGAGDAAKGAGGAAKGGDAAKGTGDAAKGGGDAAKGGGAGATA